ncbi:Uncharacterised protein [uncultured archaeon]|nr:Uncharacterised protein [uncultured archaeon]
MKKIHYNDYYINDCIYDKKYKLKKHIIKRDYI